MKKKLILVILVLSTITTYGQKITVNPAPHGSKNLNQLIQDVFLGTSCATVSNISSISVSNVEAYDDNNFPISNTAVTASRKKLKNTIELDTNIQIKMDFINPESAEKFVEKGWDEEKQMYYYLVYFNKEQKS